MPYPISIDGRVTLDLDKKSTENMLVEHLVKSDAKAEISEDQIKITWCTGFSSRATSLKEFNRGKIILVPAGDATGIHVRILLIEHLVIFSFLTVIGLCIFFTRGLESVLLKVVAMLLFANFVFCYLLPLMSLKSFIDDLKNTNQKRS